MGQECPLQCPVWPCTLLWRLKDAAARMIEKLIVGRYIEFVFPAPVMAGPAVNDVQEVTAVVQHITESESLSAPVHALPVGFNPGLKLKAELLGQKVKAELNRQTVSTSGLGANAKAHRNYVFLAWLGGLVSTIRPNGVDVLTGPMSGCWITSFMQAGQRYAGHVGTVDSPLDQQSIDAKAAWNGLVATIPPHARAGFRPFNDWVGPRPVAQPGEGAGSTYAIVTAANTFHAMILFPQMAKPGRRRIGAIQQMHDSLPPNGRI